MPPEELQTDNGALVAPRNRMPSGFEFPTAPDIEPPQEVDPNATERMIISDETIRREDKANKERLAQIQREREEAAQRVAESFKDIDESGMTPEQIKAARGVQEAFGVEPPLTPEERQEALDAGIPEEEIDRAINREFKDEFGNTRIDDGTMFGRPKTPEDRTFRDEASQADEQVDVQTQQQLDELDKLRENVSASADALIQSIKDRYELRRNDAKEQNRRRVELFEQMGIRLGTTRYAPQIQGGIVSAEERAGMQRLAEIDAEEREAIAAAERAAQSNDFAILAEKLNILEARRAEKQTLLEQQNQLALEANAKTKQQLERATRDTAIASLFSQGVTDVTQMLDLLNFDEQGNFIGDFTAQEIKETLAQIIPEAAANSGDFTLGSMDIRFDPEGNPIAFGSKVSGLSGLGYGGVTVGTAKGANGAEIPFPSEGDLDRMTAEERTFVNQVLRQLPTKLKDSEQEKKDRQREALFDFRRGRDIQAVVDEFNGFIVEDDANQDLADVFRVYAIGSEVDLRQISAAINRGAPEKAMTAVENAQLADADGFFATTDKARQTIAQSQKVIDMLTDKDFPINKLGAFDGRTFKAKRFANLTDKEDLKVQELNTALQLLNAPIRVEIVGTAATKAEMEKISDFQAKIESQPDIVLEQVQGLRDAVLLFHNQARSQRGLPEVNRVQVIDNKERLKIYQQDAKNRIQSRSDDDLIMSMTDSSLPEDEDLDNDAFFNQFP